MKYTIYKTTNLINNKIYIGKHQTLNPNDDYLGSGKALIKAIQKYGRDNFQKEILFEFNTEAEMNAKEIELVTEEFCNRKDTYNIALGGDGGWHLSNQERWSEIAALGGASVWKMFSEKRKADPIEHAKWRMNISKSLVGKPGNNKAATIAAASDKSNNKRKSTFKKINHQKGSKNSVYGKIWITDGLNSKMICPKEHIPIGWYKGRKMKV
jgi:hypothetical protein